MMITWSMIAGGNLPLGHDALLFSISGMGSFICPVAQTRLDIVVRHKADLNRRPVGPQPNTPSTRPWWPPQVGGSIIPRLLNGAGSSSYRGGGGGGGVVWEISPATRGGLWLCRDLAELIEIFRLIIYYTVHEDRESMIREKWHTHVRKDRQGHRRTDARYGLKKKGRKKRRRNGKVEGHTQTKQTFLRQTGLYKNVDIKLVDVAHPAAISLAGWFAVGNIEIANSVPFVGRRTQVARYPPPPPTPIHHDIPVTESKLCSPMLVSITAL